MVSKKNPGNTGTLSTILIGGNMSLYFFLPRYYFFRTCDRYVTIFISTLTMDDLVNPCVVPGNNRNPGTSINHPQV